MDAETVEKIADLGKEAAGPVLLTVPGSPEGKVWIRGSDGDYVEKAVADPNRKHAVQDIPTLVGLAKDVLKKNEDPAEFVEFFYSRIGVVLVYPDTRRNTAAIRLTPSPQLSALATWERGGGIAQPTLIKALRVVFKNLVSEDVQTLIRKINVTTKESSNQERGGVSLGKSVEAQIGDRDALPEYLTFTIPVFEQGAFTSVRAAVECAFDFDPSTKMFSVVPVSGSIENAFTGAENTLKSMLASEIGEQKIDESQFGIYFGTP